MSETQESDVNPYAKIESGEMSDEELAEFKHETKERLEEKNERAIEELNEEQQAALSALSNATRKETTTVQFFEQEFEVRAVLDRETKELLLELNDTESIDSTIIYTDIVPRVLEDVIVGPSEYVDRDVWRGYRAEFGNSELEDALISLCGPALERLEERGLVEGFREEPNNSAP